MLRTALAILCGVATAWLTLAAQTPAPTPAPQAIFRSSVDLVHLDVSVLDRDRRPVRGLTAADFTILEDGAVRPVAAFAALEAKAGPPPPAADSWTQRVGADVQTNEIARTPEGRLFVLLMDDGLTPQDPQAMATAKEIARTAIDRLSPGDQMAVVFTVGSKGGQNFTSDREKLLEAAATFSPGYARHMMGWDTAVQDPESSTPKWDRTMDGDAGFRTGSVRTLEMVAESLIAAPQRRKAIIFVSPGVFADSEAVTSIAMAQPGQSMMIRQANSSLVTGLPDLYRRMREANVTIYPIDPTGLGGLEAYVQRTSAGLPAMAAAATASLASDWYSLTRPPFPDQLARRVSSVSLDFLKAAASNTGGLAITDTNDLASGVARIFDENASYYLLGFSLPPGHRPGSQHRLQVKVNREDVTVRTRSGYQAPERPAPEPAPGVAPKPGPTPAATALAGPVPTGALPMRVAVAPFAANAPDQRGAVVAIALGLEHAVTRDTPQTFEVELRAFTADGSAKVGERRTGQAVLRPIPPGGDAVFDLLAQIALAPGRYELRFGAHLSPANVAGSVFADVEVPDFERDPISLSGVLLETDVGAAGPLDALKGVVPVVPTSRRALTGRDEPRAFLRVYQGGRGALARAVLRVTLRDRSNHIVFNNQFPLPAARFDATTRGADFKFTLPIAALTTGEYLLTFEARLGTNTTTRQVRFSFR